MNCKRIRPYIKGDIIGHVFLWLCLLLFPAVAAAQGISQEVARVIALCLALTRVHTTVLIIGAGASIWAAILAQAGRLAVE